MSLPDPNDPILKATEAAAELGIHVNTFKRWVALGDLVVWRVGRRRDMRIRRSEIERYKREGPRSILG